MTTVACLRQIPKVDDLLKRSDVAALLASYPRDLVVAAIREVLNQVRQELRAEKLADVPTERLFALIQARLTQQQTRHLKRVINGTGIIVHTNLGRSKLSQATIEAVVETAAAYSNLEYDLETGARGSRGSHIEPLLCELLGCETALVVNNNAAAVLLALTTLAQGREAIVSRGELVEIGGSFRIPDVMQQGGCILREVGTTNRTHRRDYEQAIQPATALILRVHTSNYRVIGFTAAVPLIELKALADQHAIPLVEDMGSGLLLPLDAFGLADEPTVQASLTAGVDVVTFSGDKLLGGPQAGVIVGKRRYVDRMKQHPLYRALRVDKMTLAALEVTLAHYRSAPEALRALPTLRAIALTSAEVRAKAERLAAQLHDAGIVAEVIETAAQVGGGALPVEQLASAGVSVSVAEMAAHELAAQLRRAVVPVLGRILKDRFLLDARTLDEADFPIIAAQSQAIMAASTSGAA